MDKEQYLPRASVKHGMTEQIEVSTNRLPGYAKLLMLVQTLIILFFTFWAFEEYQKNYYFQAYVNSNLQGNGVTIIAVSIVGIFAAVASGLYMKLRQARRVLEGLAVSEQPASASNGSGSVLAPHVEQHLIDMIRKSTPSDGSESGAMPVLKREDQPSGKAV